MSCCWCKGWDFAWCFYQSSRSSVSWINWDSWNLWGQKTLQINRERMGFVSSSLPAPIQEFRNLIQGILPGPWRKGIYSHPSWVQPNSSFFFVIWAFSLEKCLQIFCPEIHPTLTLGSSATCDRSSHSSDPRASLHCPTRGDKNSATGRNFLCKKLPGIQFNQFSPHHVIYWSVQGWRWIFH